LESVHGEGAGSRETRTDRHAKPSVVQPGTSPAAGDCYGGVVGWSTELGQAPVMLLLVETLESLVDAGSPGLRTDRKGRVFIYSTGQAVDIRAWWSASCKVDNGTVESSSVLAPSSHLFISTSNGPVSIPKASAMPVTSPGVALHRSIRPWLQHALANYPPPYTTGSHTYIAC
jgi:hypothetical protein